MIHFEAYYVRHNSVTPPLHLGQKQDNFFEKIVKSSPAPHSNGFNQTKPDLTALATSSTVFRAESFSIRLFL